MRQSLKVRDHTAPQLIVECRHAGRQAHGGPEKCVLFRSDRRRHHLRVAPGAPALDADVESTDGSHAQQVQFRATDWDFLLARAEANGKLVLTNDDKVDVKAPAKADVAVTLQFGATLLELDARDRRAHPIRKR